MAASPSTSATPLLAPGRGPLTVDDWYALPDTPDRYELYQGVLVMAPPPGEAHQGVVGLLAAAVLDHALANGGFAWAAPFGVALGSDTAFEPDVAYVSAARMDRRRRRGLAGAPDVVVEVLSPATRRYDLETKLPAYPAAGTREVWIADPEARTVTVHSVGAEPRSAPFGEPIPSAIAPVGSGRLERLPPPADD